MDESRSILLLHGVGSSASTWWRAKEDLSELGWSVTALDLLGHGGRPITSDGLLGLSDLADDVRAQLGTTRFDVVLGHSLGALVALVLGAQDPTLAPLVLLEDPPALGGSFSTEEVADELVAEAARAWADPDAFARELDAANPRWAARDVAAVVENRRRLAVQPVTGLLRGSSWDLLALLTACPVPVGLIAAEGPDTALVPPARAGVLDALPADRLALVHAGHGVHRDRPALWLQAVLRLAGAA